MPSIPDGVRRGASGLPKPPVFFVLVLLSGVSPLAIDMYLPGLPELGQALNTDAAGVQATLTVFFIGLAIGQIAFGSMSDSLGRRVFLLSGPALFILASIVCAIAPNALVFIIARSVQGLAGGAAVVCARATVSDYYTGTAAAKRFGQLSAVTMLAPMFAPVLGALLLIVGDWRLIFFALAAIGLVQLFGVLVGVPETLPPENRHPGSLGATLVRMGGLLRDRVFMLHVAVVSSAMMGLFTYVGGSSFVLQEVYGIDAGLYSVVFGVNAGAMGLTSYLFSRFAGRITLVGLRRLGLMVAAGPSSLLAVLAALDSWSGWEPPPFWLTWTLLGLLSAGMGFVLPASTTLSQQAGKHARGTAAALAAGIGFTASALVIPLTGLLDPNTLLPMAGLMALWFVVALLASKWAQPRAEGPDGPP